MWEAHSHANIHKLTWILNTNTTENHVFMYIDNLEEYFQNPALTVTYPTSQPAKSQYYYYFFLKAEKNPDFILETAATTGVS